MTHRPWYIHSLHVCELALQWQQAALDTAAIVPVCVATNSVRQLECKK